ncbi:MAG TPA: cobalamin-dependent protein [Terriglobales bacterium]|nr:cobalamin-dependent protein [Terriglobales bacterium]
MERRIRVLVGKPGLDGHDRGAKVVAAALRDSGMEVIYTGLHQTPEQIVEAATQEDVDVVALSILSGAHMTLFPEVLERMKARGLGDRLLTGGGIIPSEDMEKLSRMGVGRLFGPGTSTQDIIAYIRDWFAREHGGAAPVARPAAREEHGKEAAPESAESASPQPLATTGRLAARRAADGAPARSAGRAKRARLKTEAAHHVPTARPAKAAPGSAASRRTGVAAGTKTAANRGRPGRAAPEPKRVARAKTASRASGVTAPRPGSARSAKSSRRESAIARSGGAARSKSAAGSPRRRSRRARIARGRART